MALSKRAQNRLEKLSYFYFDKEKESDLNEYLECEKLLNEFFSTLNFCKTHCINKKVSLYEQGSNYPGNIGCCFKDSYVGHYSLLNDSQIVCLETARIKKYGLPNSKDSCDYHKADGCRLKTHKSPICISYVCFIFQDYLHSKGIKYDGNKIGIFLSEILKGHKTKDEISKFKSEINDFIKKI